MLEDERMEQEQRSPNRSAWEPQQGLAWMNRAWDYWAAVEPRENEPLIHVNLQLEADLQRHAPRNPKDFELERGATVGGLMARLGIREDEVMLVFVNGRMATKDTTVTDRATVSLCPYICGG